MLLLIMLLIIVYNVKATLNNEYCFISWEVVFERVYMNNNY